MIFDNTSPEYFMSCALAEAKMAFEEDEVPIGAVVVIDNTIIAKAHNLTETLSDPTAHAEILAITTATEHLRAKYLPEASLYVTVEPCLMCAGAIFWSKIKRLYFGAFDEKHGISRVQNNLSDNISVFHPKLSVSGQILEAQCAELMRSFFAKKRGK